MECSVFHKPSPHSQPWVTSRYCSAHFFPWFFPFSVISVSIYQPSSPGGLAAHLRSPLSTGLSSWAVCPVSSTSQLSPHLGKSLGSPSLYGLDLFRYVAGLREGLTSLVALSFGVRHPCFKVCKVFFSTNVGFFFPVIFPFFTFSLCSLDFIFLTVHNCPLHLTNLS